MAFLNMKVLLFFSFVCSCTAKKVLFFKEEDFKGEIYEAESSASCNQLPHNILGVNGSIKTTGCIVLSIDPYCYTFYLVWSEKASLFDLVNKYKNSRINQHFEVNSFRDCTEMQNRAEIDVDIYDNYFDGKKWEFRDICGCINLPLNSTGQSIKSYGNCVKIYKTENCNNEPLFTVYQSALIMERARSIEPCHLPPRCKIRLEATAVRLEPVSNVLKLSGGLLRVPIKSAETIINTGEANLEYLYEATNEINESMRLELPKLLTKMASVSLNDDFIVDILTNAAFLANASDFLKNGLAMVFENRHFHNEDSVKYEQYVKREVRVYEKIMMSPQTAYEIESFVKMVTNADIPCRMQILITGNNTESGRMSVEEIVSSLKLWNNLIFLNNTTESQTVFAEVIVNLRLSYAFNVKINSVSTPYDVFTGQESVYNSNK